MLNAQAKVSELKGVGPAAAKRLAALGIQTLGNLVHHLPRTYEDRSEITDISAMAADHRCTIRGTIEKIATRRAHRRRMTITEALVTDPSGSIKVVWFNKPYLEDQLAVGDELFLTGAPKDSKYGLALQSPEHEKVLKPTTSATDADGTDSADATRQANSSGGNSAENTETNATNTVEVEQLHTARIVPEYPLTAGITHKQMRFWIKQALDYVLPMPDPLPAEVREQYQLLEIGDALRQVHFPENPEAFTAAHRRLDFDTLFITQLYVLQQREQFDSQKAQQLEFNEAEIKQFVADLPFELTGAQRRAAWDALQDIQKDRPMNRLVVGDVGSGKTVVAAIALYNTVLNGTQGLLMAPTELLAKQHYANLRELFADKDVNIALLTGSTKTIDAESSPEMNAHIIVGTHALIQEKVGFHNLGLVVVDEQHRFGVKQRKALREKSGNPDTLPHLLSMTATPIPRTLALALYSDLDLSIIDEMPIGRKTIKTHLVPSRKRRDAYTFIEEHIAKGEQTFVICPLIDPSDKLEVKSVTEEYEKLNEQFKNRSVEMLHGKMKPAEKDELMRQMRDKQIDILVATSVIEVGVDIPDATIMVIEGAERFGLAQLHQFRGRVGRSDMQAYCFLFTDSRSDKTLERLEALVNSNDGFALAEKDLELRGAGELLGTLQSGFSDAAFLAVQQPDLLDAAKRAAEQVRESKYMDSKKGSVLKKQLDNFAASIHLE